MNTETEPENFKGKYSHEAGEQEEGDRVMEELKRMFANIFSEERNSEFNPDMNKYSGSGYSRSAGTKNNF